ncbi:MAG: beta-lactamase family protein [Bellilinea sp.]|nr:beta-lactamase family protein [Bellilinea sp.]
MIKKSVWVFTLLILLFGSGINTVSSQATNQPPDFKELDTFILEQMNKHDLPGVALTIVSGDQIIFAKGYGTEGNRPMTSTTPMLIGSQSKSFTALAIAQLAEQRKIDFNAPVQNYLPWFRVADESASSQITINHLLHHTSGLSEAGISRVFSPDTTTEEMVRALKDVPLTAPVGTTFQYFNYGYDILGLIVETVSGMSYADYLDIHIFQPLQMKQSTANPYAADDLSRGYTRLFGFPVPWREPIPLNEIPAGFIVSTAEDLGRYAIAVKNQNLPGVGKLTTQRIFTPGQDDYGMGWWIDNQIGTKRIYHGGANRTFRTDVNIYPQRDLGFVVLVNMGSLFDHYISMAQLRNGIEAILLGKSAAAAASGWSVRWIGWGIGAFVLGLLILHTRNFLALRGWRARMKTVRRQKVNWDIAISFLIPTVILIVVLSQVAGFYGYRFNLITTLAYLPGGNPDIFILLLVGSLPDYIQGLIKLIWSFSLRDKTLQSVP